MAADDLSSSSSRAAERFLENPKNRACYLELAKNNPGLMDLAGDQIPEYLGLIEMFQPRRFYTQVAKQTSEDLPDRPLLLPPLVPEFVRETLQKRGIPSFPIDWNRAEMDKHLRLTNKNALDDCFVSALPRLRGIQNAVFPVYSSGYLIGTCFLVKIEKKTFFMTAGHVAIEPDLKICDQKPSEILVPQKFKENNCDHGLDMALIRIPEMPGSNPLKISDIRLAAGVPLATIGFPVGSNDASIEKNIPDYFPDKLGVKRFSFAKSAETVEKKVFSHLCNTLGGSSGSPILALSGKEIAVVGIHIGFQGFENRAINLTSFQAELKNCKNWGYPSCFSRPFAKPKTDAPKSSTPKVHLKVSLSSLLEQWFKRIGVVIGIVDKADFVDDPKITFLAWIQKIKRWIKNLFNDPRTGQN